MFLSGAAGKKAGQYFSEVSDNYLSPPEDFADATVQQTLPAYTQPIMTKCPAVLLLVAQGQE